MKIAALIAEFNPFHNGHEYLINRIREDCGCDHLIAIMSPDFTQRGEPALYSKEFRTRMALTAGIDAVFTLPVACSTAGAELFALSGVTLAHKLGASVLCFGSECGDINRLLDAANILRTAGTIESDRIKDLIREGNTFAKARALAFPEYADFLNGANNILAIEYIIAALNHNYPFEFYTVKRIGADYSENSLVNNSVYQSASAVRSLLLNGKADLAKEYVPGSVFSLMLSEKDCDPPLSPDDFSDILFTKLMSIKDECTYFEASEDLLNRIKSNLNEYRCFSGFTDMIKAKNLTRAGVSRALLHILLDINKPADHYKQIDSLSYVRLLGFRESSEELFSEIKRIGKIKIATKIPAITDDLDEYTKDIFKEDLYASMLYEYIKIKKSGRDPVHDYSKPVIKI